MRLGAKPFLTPHPPAKTDIAPATLTNVIEHLVWLFPPNKHAFTAKAAWADFHMYKYILYQYASCNVISDVIFLHLPCQIFSRPDLPPADFEAAQHCQPQINNWQTFYQLDLNKDML